MTLPSLKQVLADTWAEYQRLGLTAEAWREEFGVDPPANQGEDQQPMMKTFCKAFEVWENEFRAHPERFMTPEQVAAAEVLTLAAQRAACFMAILDKLPKETTGTGEP